MAPSSRALLLIPSPDAPIQALWRIPITIHDVRVLTAPDLVPHLPYMTAIAVGAAATSRLLSKSTCNR